MSKGRPYLSLLIFTVGFSAFSALLYYLEH